jgi:hypothetical protein
MSPIARPTEDFRLLHVELVGALLRMERLDEGMIDAIALSALGRPIT